jgi:hypothetical protein
MNIMILYRTEFKYWNAWTFQYVGTTTYQRTSYLSATFPLFGSSFCSVTQTGPFQAKLSQSSNRHSQTAEFGDWSHLGLLGPSRHWHNEIGSERAVLGWALVAKTGTKLKSTLNMNVQCLQLLPVDALKHSRPGSSPGVAHSVPLGTWRCGNS